MPEIDLTAVHSTSELEYILQSTQGHILEKHRRDHVWNVLLRFTPGSKIAPMLSYLPCNIPSASDLRSERTAITEKLDTGDAPDARPPVCFLGLTASGCTKVGGDMAGFSIPFKDGVRSRATTRLGMKTQPWDTHWNGRPFDAILVCCAEGTSDLSALIAKLKRHFDDSADMTIEKGTVIRKQGVGVRKGYAIEHFGFADGISQPSLETDVTRAPGYHSGYNPEARLNTILIRDPLLKDDCAFGSYMAYLKIEQHVDAFHRAAAEIGSKLPMPSDSEFTPAAQGAALLMGRRRDGTPLIGGGRDDNDFSRRLDQNGTSWPFDAHICKMNPRDSVNRTFLIRRGITYDDGVAKGLLFQSFQADLEFQFELLATSWARDPNHPITGCGRDKLVVTMPASQGGDAPRWAPVDVSSLVTLRGGEYFYFPSIPAIKALAGS